MIKTWKLSFLSGDIHGGISKYLVLSFCHMDVSCEGGYWSSVDAVRFCAVGVPMDWVWGSCTGGCEAVALLAGAVCHGGLQIREAVAFGSWCLGAGCGLAGGLVARLFGGVCFFCPLVYGFYLVVLFWVVSWRPEADHTPLNDLSIVFQSPSSVKHCKVGTMHGGRGSHLQEPLRIIHVAWAMPHIDVMCVSVCGTCWFCVWSGGILQLD